MLPSLQTQILVALALPTAEDAASASSSASCYDLAEHIGMLPMIMSELKFSKVQRQILFAYMVKLTHNSALQQRPKTINARRVNQSAYIFALPVSNGFVVIILIKQTITRMLVGGEKRHSFVHCLTDESIKRRGICVLYHLTNHITLARD